MIADYLGFSTVCNLTAPTTPNMVLFTSVGQPGCKTKKYAGPITVSASETLKVIATETGYTSSPVVSNSYTIQ